MGRKRKQKIEPLTLEQQLTIAVSELLNGQPKTPKQIYDFMILSYKAVSGRANWQNYDAIIAAFANHGQHYLTPMQLAALKGVYIQELDAEDLEYLKEP